MSEYTFPIFISSTDYNLKDLRAELARFLKQLGYKPYLSSEGGFADKSPGLQPWESCLHVLDKCFVTILIIDSRYGTCLPWPNFQEYFPKRKVSPTHAEYIYAHRNKKRMFVFIRRELMPLYQCYRTAMESTGNDKNKTKRLLSPILPKHVQFETLDFINEVKTTKPIPWINEFDDITFVKREIQKKMLNELSELFLVKNAHLDTVIDAFNKVIGTLSPDMKKAALQKVNATKELLIAAEELDKLNKQMEEANKNLVNAKTADKKKYEKEIGILTQKIDKLEKETLTSSSSQFFIQNGQIKAGNPNYVPNLANTYSAFLHLSEPIINNNNLIATLGVNVKECDRCSAMEPITFPTNTSGFNTCPSCHEYLCPKCWPKPAPLAVLGIQQPYQVCPVCKSNKEGNQTN